MVPAVCHKLPGIGVKVPVVSLEVDQPPGLENAAVLPKETRRSETLVFLFRLRIGKGYPYLRNFPRGKKISYMIYHAPYEGSIGQVLVFHGAASPPQTCALDVHAYVIPVGMGTSKSHSVFTLAAAKLKRYGIRVAEKISVPVSLQCKSLLKFMVPELKKKRESEILLKMNQFLFGHEEIYFESSQAPEKPFSLASRRRPSASF